jgi:voltage-dependent calcium channel
VRFRTPGTSPSSARLGDDLAQAEAGLSPNRSSMSARRSLSPGAAGSTLHRAGTIMRNMSQRIVNLSNEQDVVDRTMRRKSSTSSHKAGRLDAPPEFPAFDVPSVDGPRDDQGEEKGPSLHTVETPSAESLRPHPMPNPLRGKSLGIFSPDNPVRLRLCDLLTHSWTEPIIFALIIAQVILLVIDSSQNVFDHPRTARWGSPVDSGLMVIFAIYTAEIISKIIVSGFILNPIEYSTINRQVGFRQAVMAQMRKLFGAQAALKAPTGLSNPDSLEPAQPSIFRAFTTSPALVAQQGGSRYQRRVRLAHRAFLRHSFNRLDFIAVVSYWVSFILALLSLQNQHEIYVFRMLSCFRILKLLYITNGTTVILRSLKKAAPLLLNVAILIGFFWLLFAIIAMQSFKASLRRQCVWFNQSDPSGQSNYTNAGQYCGGWLDQSSAPQPWLLPDGTNGAATHKGFLCPVNSKCIQGTGPYNGTVSFDNIFQSIELVFVIMTSNTFSDLLYNLTMSDYLAAALFFACGTVILFFWLISLLIAVITSSFQVIREEGRASAFTGEEQEGAISDEDEVANKPRQSAVKKIYNKSYWFWIVLISYGLIVQCLTSATMGPGRARFISDSETIVTFLLLFEIVIRFVADWRSFVRSRRNAVDLFLAILTSIIQIPPIHNSGQPYAWLTIFQIVRIYRVVLAVPITRELIVMVVSNWSGMLNLILFVFLLTFLASILAAEMFRGTLPQVDASGNNIRTTFQTIWNSFLGMYQILSSENWTDIMYHVTSYTVNFNTAWMGAAFFIIWFVLGNFIVLNMFIAVIQENFDISEDDKRMQQVRAFLEQKEGGGAANGNLSLSTIFKFGLVSGRRRDPLAFSGTTEMLLKDAVVRDFLDQEDEPAPSPDLNERPTLRTAPTKIVGSGTLGSWWESLISRLRHSEPNPFYSSLEFSRAYQDLDPRTMAREVVSARERRKRAQREFLLKHPSYNVSLYIFKPDNPVRKVCQRIVGPGRGGDRIEGVAPSVPIWYAFSAFIYAAIVAMVLLACITTPLYQMEYFTKHPFSVKNWFVFSDIGFAVLFTVEAAIKVIADGFFFTPNAYFRSSWGFIDGVVLVTLWVGIGTALANEGQVSRAIGAFKALRALRLLNVSDSARNNFHAVIIRGGWKIVSAAFVSLSFLVPFALWGLNLFVGKMQACNDNNAISDLNDCVGEYNSSPYTWNVWAPRHAANSYFSFDNFGDSLFILFQIVSQEGWIDVMWRAQSITGVFTQPQPFTSQGYAVFFVLFNLLGAIFILTLFVSVFMRNYTEQTGVAFLTADQRAWLELRKLLRQISPSKRPLSNQRRESWKEWCYRRAVRKSGGWQRFVTYTLIAHLVLLCLEWYPDVGWWDRTRDGLFLLLSFVYIANIVIRIIGLTFARFRRSSWDLYSLISVSGTFVTTLLILAQPNDWVLGRINKLYLVSITLLLIPRNNQLDQLFKTAAASLPLILNLLATWFVLFLTFAIALTQTFGLTRFNTNEAVNINFRDVPKALILLFRMSVGEGWNQIMQDLAAVRPPFCTVGGAFQSDCGSEEWARALLILWNLLSMYIFANLFISLIYESFSYVYQRSSGLSVISREEIRRFKQAWAEFDADGTGYISKEAFPRLLGELSGVFEMRIYDGDFTVARLIEDCSQVKRVSGLPVEGQQEQREIDLVKLNRRLADLPIKEIRKRRARMNKFYEEVLVSSDPDRGIAFTSLLIILAHYKVINDNRSLR